MLTWLDTHVLAIHALAELLTTVSIVSALAMLWRFSLETKKLTAKLAAQESRREVPFVVLQHDKGKDSDLTSFFNLLNIGNSPALNIHVSIWIFGESQTITIGAMATGEVHELVVAFPSTDEWVATIEYGNLSGTRLSTLVDTRGVQPTFTLVRDDQD